MNLHFQKLAQYLRNLSDIPDSELLEFSKLIKVNNYRPGDLFCEIDKPSDKLGFVVDGLFKIYYTKGNKTFIRSFAAEGAPVASYATLLSSKLAHVNIEAIEPSFVLEIPFNEFISFYKRHPSWEKFGRKVAEDMYVTREHREFQLLTMDALQRYEQFLEEFPNISNRVTQANIAAYLGISPVSLSRLLKDYKKKAQ